MNSHDSSTDPPRRPTSLDALMPGGAPAAPSAGTEPQGEPVDQIAVRKLGGFNVISPEQWYELPREEQMRLLRGGLVTFLFEGEEVAPKAALLGLQAQRDALLGQREERPAPTGNEATGGFPPPTIEMNVRPQEP